MFFIAIHDIDPKASVTMEEQTRNQILYYYCSRLLYF